MPELPDITVYIEALESRVLGQRLEKARPLTNGWAFLTAYWFQVPSGGNSSIGTPLRQAA